MPRIHVHLGHLIALHAVPDGQRVEAEDVGQHPLRLVVPGSGCRPRPCRRSWPAGPAGPPGDAWRAPVPAPHRCPHEPDVHDASPERPNRGDNPAMIRTSVRRTLPSRSPCRADQLRLRWVISYGSRVAGSAAWVPVERSGPAGVGRAAAWGRPSDVKFEGTAGGRLSVLLGGLARPAHPGRQRRGLTSGETATRNAPRGAATSTGVDRAAAQSADSTVRKIRTLSAAQRTAWSTHPCRPTGCSR